MRCAVILVLLAAGVHAFSAAPADRVSLNKEDKALPAGEWLALISHETKTPVVLAGPLSGRRAACIFHNEFLGDALDDLSGFYGYTWREAKGVVALASRMKASGMPPKLAEWVDARRKALRVPISFPEALVLSTYSDDALAEVGRYCANVGIDPAPYRVIRSLTPAQAAKAAGDGLGREELTDAQVQLVETLLKKQDNLLQWPEGAKLRYVTVRDQEDPARGEVTLDLQRKDDGSGGARTIILFGWHLNDRDPVYPVLPPPAGQPGAPPTCEISLAGDKVSALVKSAPAKLVLERLSSAGGEKLSGEASLQDASLSLWAEAADRAAILDGIAAALDGQWEDNPGGGKLLRANPRKQAKPEPTPTLAEALSTLFSYVSQDPPERLLIGGCNPDVIGLISSGSYPHWAIRFLHLVDPSSPERADRAGELPVDTRFLPEEGVELLLEAGRRRTTYAETGEPVYDRGVLMDSRTEIKFTWDGQGNYNLGMYNADVRTRVDMDFSLQPLLNPQPVHLPVRWLEKPWFLGFPKDVPRDYLDYLDRTRAWRGSLALKHVAPLAFTPESKWPAIRKKVPEFAVVNHANRRAVQYYAVLDHIYRCQAQGKGVDLTDFDMGLVDLRLLGAIQMEAGLKWLPPTKDDAVFLRTDQGVAKLLEFRLQGRTFTFPLPKASELLGEEGCALGS